MGEVKPTWLELLMGIIVMASAAYVAARLKQIERREGRRVQVALGLGDDRTGNHRLARLQDLARKRSRLLSWLPPPA